MDKNVNVIEQEKPFPFFTILYKRLLLIIMITILCALLSLAYCIAMVKPVYTASSSVILRMSVGDSNAGTVTTNVSLSKLYIADVVNIIESPTVVDYANTKYEDGGIRAGNISAQYRENSLIFNISYTDTSEEGAKAKLATIIECASETLSNGAVEAKSVSLIPTQSDSSVSVNNSFVKYILLGTAAGIIIAVLISLFLYAMDNTVSDKRDFEELTDVSVLAYITKLKETK